jgi:thiol-disulfide isomerase/thioredoxin
MLSLPSIGQTFNDCSLNYHTKYNKIAMEAGRHFITRKTSDSLRAVLDAELEHCIIGKEIGDYTLTGRSGKTYTQDSLKGKVVLFNFWSVNCGPCIIEIPWLNKLYRSYKENKDFVLISILLDKEEDLDKLLNRGLTKTRIGYEVVPNAKSIIKENFKLVKAYPRTSLLIERVRYPGGL